MIKVNLVPDDILAAEKQKELVYKVGAVGVLVAIAFAGVSFWHYNRKVTLEKELVAKKAEFEKLKHFKKKLSNARKKQKRVKQRLQVIRGIIADRELFPRFMQDMIDVIPRGIYVTKLKVTEGKKYVISLNGVATKPGQITDWLRVLESSTPTIKMNGTFANPKVGSVNLKGNKNTFPLTMEYTPPDLKEKDKR